MSREGLIGWPSRAALALATLVLLALAIPAAASASYNDLPGESLGGDAFYESAAVFDQTTPEFDTGEFDVEPWETPGANLACGKAYGAKDAWVRFATGVSGNLNVAASKKGPGHLFFIVYAVPSANPGFAELTQHQVNCESSHESSAETYAFGFDLTAHTVAFVQVLDVCNLEAPCSPEQEEDAEGGETKVHLRFTPVNTDGDAFPDTVDHCLSIPGAFHGCPDGDGDGVGDADDACPTVFGRAPNGCRLPDEDGDGYAARAAGGNDCNDNNPAINPGARDIPANGVDENCDGRDSPYPVLRNEVDRLLAYSPSRGRTVGFLSPFKVAGPLVRGMVVRLTCSGRGCPFSREAKTIRKDKPGGIEIGKKLVRKVLAPGASVTLLISRRGYVGEAIRFTVRKHGKMRIEELCMPPGTTRPKKKCS